MKVIVNTPTHEQSYEVAWLEINTPSGNYVIQIGHAPTILTLSPNELCTFRLKTGKQESLAIQRGFVSIDRESARIVAVIKK